MSSSQYQADTRTPGRLCNGHHLPANLSFGNLLKVDFESWPMRPIPMPVIYHFRMPMRESQKHEATNLLFSAQKARQIPQ